MRAKWMVCVLVCVAATAYARDNKPYETAKLLQMNSVNCGTTEKDARSPLGEIIGTDNGSRKSEQVLCQEYVLQTDAVIYHIRPKDEKHPALLPVGSQAQFRIEKAEMLLRVDGVSNKDLKYEVVSMTPRSGTTTAADSAPVSPSAAH